MDFRVLPGEGLWIELIEQPEMELSRADRLGATQPKAEGEQILQICWTHAWNGLSVMVFAEGLGVCWMGVRGEEVTDHAWLKAETFNVPSRKWFTGAGGRPKGCWGRCWKHTGAITWELSARSFGSNLLPAFKICQGYAAHMSARYSPGTRNQCDPMSS